MEAAQTTTTTTNMTAAPTIVFIKDPFLVFEFRFTDSMQYNSEVQHAV